MKMRIAFIITGLGSGGAEMMLFKLLSRLDRERFHPRVVSLTSLDILAPLFKEIDVRVDFLGMRQGIPDPRGVLRLTRILRRESPHLVQTWMYHADLLGGIAAKAAGRLPVVWNIRNGPLEPGAAKRGTLLTVRACAYLSRHLPERIVCCAEAARRIHVGFGYDPERFVVIPNGFDTVVFRPDTAARLSVRQEMGWSAEATVVGLIARFHPQKDHAVFLAAAGSLARERPELRFLLCGDGITTENAELAGAIGREGLASKVRLLGRRSDVPRLTAACDLAVSSSYSGEAFSNSLGEAMACGVPCVATDVGDAALIVGDSGRIVPCRNPQALKAAMANLLGLSAGERQELGLRARQRVLQHFSIDAVASRYTELYEGLFATEQFGTRPKLAGRG